MLTAGEYVKVQNVKISNRITIIDPSGQKFTYLEPPVGAQPASLMNEGFFVIDDNHEMPKVSVEGLKGYEQLVNYFYTKEEYFGRTDWIPKQQHLPIWLTRWEETQGEDICLVPLQAPFASDVYFSLPKTWDEGSSFWGPNCDWALTVLKDDEDRSHWVMPVFRTVKPGNEEDDNFDTLQFIPTDPFSDPKYKYNIPNWYHRQKIFPKSRTIQLAQEEGSGVPPNKKVRLFLHGFLQPTQLFYKFWKHVLGQKDDDGNCNTEEKYAWDSWLDETSHDIQAEEQKTIREIHEKNKIFGRLSRDEYQTIQNILSGVLSGYIEKMVTIFQNPQTLKVKIAQSNGTSHWPCIVNILGNRLDDPYNQFIPHLSCRGSCYNWNTTSGEQIRIHLNVKTFYLKDEGNNANLLEGVDWFGFNTRNNDSQISIWVPSDD